MGHFNWSGGDNVPLLNCSEGESHDLFTADDQVLNHGEHHLPDGSKEEADKQKRISWIVAAAFVIAGTLFV